MVLRRRLEGDSRTPTQPAQPAAPPSDTAAPPKVEAPPRPATPTATATLTKERAKEKDLKTRVQDRLIKEMDPKMDVTDKEKVRQQIRQLFDQIMDEEGVLLPRTEKDRLYEAIVADIVGFGPIEPLLNDDTVSEVMVNGPYQVYVERKGKLVLTEVRFDDDDHVRRVIERIVAPLGRRCDESTPIADARLPDGSRVNAIIPPLSLVGPALTIRKFAKNRLYVEDLIRFGSMTAELGEFLRACVIARLNIVVVGGTGSGKTTLLNVLSGFIPEDERIITVEDAAELQLSQPHVVRLETRKPNIEGKGAVTIRDLVINCLRMRPERIIVGECRGGEALDMLQAMNTGHDGSLTTIHANNPKDGIARLEVMCLMAGMELPIKAIRSQIASAVQLLVFQGRLRDGTRKISYVTEVQGMEGDTIVTQDIFVFEQTSITPEGKIIGQLKPTGLRPKFMDKIEDAGIHLAPNIFGAQDRIF